MMSDNTLLDFEEKQEILDNLNVTLKKMYADDEDFNDSESINILCERTYDVMEYIENIQKDLENDPAVHKTAKKYNISTEEMIKDISEIMLMSTVARQAIELDQLEE